jgi:hypothetical protein
MTEDEEKKLQEMMQYDMMGQPIPQVVGWGTFPVQGGANTQNNVAPVIVNPNPEGAS